MAALMVPFGLKSFFGLYPESCRFLIYSAPAPTGACANAGIAAVADSSMAAARALNEVIFVSPVWIDSRPACCLDCELSACSIRCGCLVLDVERPHADPIKFRFNRLNSAGNARYRVNRLRTGI